jgi:hypothetical protein
MDGVLDAGEKEEGDSGSAKILLSREKFAARDEIAGFLLSEEIAKKFARPGAEDSVEQTVESSVGQSVDHSLETDDALIETETGEEVSAGGVMLQSAVHAPWNEWPVHELAANEGVLSAEWIGPDEAAGRVLRDVGAGGDGEQLAEGGKALAGRNVVGEPSQFAPHAQQTQRQPVAIQPAKMEGPAVALDAKKLDRGVSASVADGGPNRLEGKRGQNEEVVVDGAETGVDFVRQAVASAQDKRPYSRLDEELSAKRTRDSVVLRMQKLNGPPVEGESAGFTSEKLNSPSLAAPQQSVAPRLGKPEKKADGERAEAERGGEEWEGQTEGMEFRSGLHHSTEDGSEAVESSRTLEAAAKSYLGRAPESPDRAANPIRTIRIRLPITEAAEGAAGFSGSSNLDIGITRRLHQVEIRMDAPTAALQRSVAESIGALARRLAVDNWQVDGQALGQEKASLNASPKETKALAGMNTDFQSSQVRSILSAQNAEAGFREGSQSNQDRQNGNPLATDPNGSRRDSPSHGQSGKEGEAGSGENALGLSGAAFKRAQQQRQLWTLASGHAGLKAPAVVRETEIREIKVPAVIEESVPKTANPNTERNEA